MEMKIMILTLTKCSPKDKQPYTRVDYIALDNQTKSENVKGHIVAPIFFNGHEVFDKITPTFLNKEVTALIEYVSNPYNPSRPKMQIKSLTHKDETIDLL